MKAILLFISTILVTTCFGDTIVETKSGKLRGKKITVLSKSVNAFLAIPYAVPPVGELRFRKPRPVQPWNDIYDATKFPPSCMQSNSLATEWTADRRYMQEDCLYLNIWVPIEQEDDKPFSTLVWIHGGGYNSGSTNLELYDGRVIASLGNVIVASMNYRLGSLGFLNIGSEEAPGNMAMWDQVEALRWIHDNIEAFGGNPSDITIFGESAGGFSVSNHIVSPVTKGLFQRAIIESGTSYNPNVTLSPSVSKFMSGELANRLGCISPNMADNHDIFNKLSEVMMTCMRNVNASIITEVERSVRNPLIDLLTFLPSYGDEYLPNSVHDEVNGGNFNDVDVMIGHVKDEGSLFLSIYIPLLMKEDYPKLKKSDAEEGILRSFQLQHKSSLKTIFDEYLENVPNDDFPLILQNTHSIIGDCIIKCPTILFADEVAKRTRNVYYYTFDHSRIKKNWKKWIGVPHFEEISFVFGVPLLKPEEFTLEEIELSKTIIEIWTSFAKTGIPSSKKLKQDWPRYSEDNSAHIEVSLTDLTFTPTHPANKCKYWKNCYQKDDCIH